MKFSKSICFILLSISLAFTAHAQSELAGDTYESIENQRDYKSHATVENDKLNVFMTSIVTCTCTCVTEGGQLLWDRPLFGSPYRVLVPPKGIDCSAYEENLCEGQREATANPVQGVMRNCKLTNESELQTK